jgi:hypothetical protein
MGPVEAVLVVVVVAVESDGVPVVVVVEVEFDEHEPKEKAAALASSNKAFFMTKRSLKRTGILVPRFNGTALLGVAASPWCSSCQR